MQRWITLMLGITRGWGNGGERASYFLIVQRESNLKEESGSAKGEVKCDVESTKIPGCENGEQMLSFGTIISLHHDRTLLFLPHQMPHLSHGQLVITCTKTKHLFKCAVAHPCSSYFRIIVYIGYYRTFILRHHVFCMIKTHPLAFIAGTNA